MKIQMYRIEYAKQVKKDLEKFPKRDRLAILEKIESLTTMPRPNGVISLKGKSAGYYRIRMGDYRVIYTIEDKQLIILIVKIGQRGSVYSDL